MDSQPLSPRPKPKAIPLINGSSPLHTTQKERDANEREHAYASIKSSMGPVKQPIDLDNPHYFQAQQQSVPRNKRPMKLSNLDEVDARDPRDELPTPSVMSRSSSPYTQNPTVDFDGLSWPSTPCLAYPQDASQRLTMTQAPALEKD